MKLSATTCKDVGVYLSQYYQFSNSSSNTKSSGDVNEARVTRLKTQLVIGDGIVQLLLTKMKLEVKKYAKQVEFRSTDLSIYIASRMTETTECLCA